MAKIKNRERLRAKLRALPDAIRAEIKPALEKGAQDIADLAYHLAPVESGSHIRRHPAGALRASIDWGYGPPSPSAILSGGGKKQPTGKGNIWAGEVSASPEFDLLISVWAGNDRAYYARWVEFGTQASTVGQRVTDKRRKKSGATRIAKRSHPGTKAQPFFYPAYRATKKSVTARVSRAAVAAIRKVASKGGV